MAWLLAYHAPYGASVWGAAAARYGSARSVISLAAAISNLSSPLHRHDLVALDRLGGAKRRPCIHQPPSLLEQIGAPICPLDRAANSVSERLLDNDVVVARPLVRPIAERATEPMRGDVRAPHALSQVPHHRVSQRLAVLAGEDEVIAGGTKLLHPLEHGERGIRQRDAMLAAGLHARARYDPNLIEQIKLRPLRADHLADPSRGQDCKFERARRDAFAAA